MDKRRGNKNLSPGTTEIKILIAGAGGQGILLLGKILASAFLLGGKEVSWLPSYGAEVRGGTCKCMVVVSNTRISSPYIFHPDCLIVMNEPSYRKYSSALDSQGMVFYNQSLIKKELLNPELNNIGIPATETALKIGNIQSANMVMLGAFIKATEMLKLSLVEKVLSQLIKKETVLQQDIRALDRGFEYV